MAVENDASVVGTGISGGWAATELCEKGLRTLLLERGLGYFSSEIGCKQAQRCEEAPDAYHGKVLYVNGEKAWCNPTRRVG